MERRGVGSNWRGAGSNSLLIAIMDLNQSKWAGRINTKWPNNIETRLERFLLQFCDYDIEVSIKRISLFCISVRFSLNI